MRPLAAILALALISTTPGPTPLPARPTPPEIARLLQAFAGDWTVHESFEISANRHGTSRNGVARFREGAGPSLIEDYASDGTAGELRFLGIFWWDPKARLYRL